LRKFNLLLLTFLAVAGLSSCGSKKAFESAYDPEQLPTGLWRAASEEELVSVLEQNTEDLEEIWVKFGVTVRREDERVLPSFTAIALYKEPDLVKLGLRRFEIGTVYSILIRGQEAQMYANREGDMYVGTLEELAERTPLMSGLSPRDLVGAVTVQRDLLDLLKSNRPRRVSDQGEKLLVAARHPVTRRQFFYLVRKKDALIEEVLIRTAEGEPEVRILYGGYDLVENEVTGSLNPYPAELTFKLLEQNLTVEADVKEYRLTPEFPDDIWTLPEPENVYRLRDVTFEEL
jgi:hypothetical protein